MLNILKNILRIGRESPKTFREEKNLKDRLFQLDMKPTKHGEIYGYKNEGVERIARKILDMVYLAREREDFSEYFNLKDKHVDIDSISDPLSVTDYILSLKDNDTLVYHCILSSNNPHLIIRTLRPGEWADLLSNIYNAALTEKTKKEAEKKEAEERNKRELDYVNFSPL